LAKPTTSDPTPPWRAAFALTLLGYLLAGWAALTLAIPPGYASPLYPAAGVAMAGVLIGGWRVLPAVALGAFTVNLSLSPQRANLDMAALLLPLVIGVGAALQAGAGAMLVKRHARQPLTLSEPRDVAVFLLASIASCCLSSGLANTALWLSHTVQTSQLPFSLATWWVGDLLGVLIATPVVLCFFGRPREAWAPRRTSVGLTLMLVTVLLAIGIRQVAGWNRERVQAAFDRDASTASLLLSAQLREPLQALEALRGVYVASDDVTRAELALATQAWLAPGRLQAMGWSERVRRVDVPAFEARVRAEGLPKYAVFNRADAPPPDGDDVVAMRFVEPMAGNESALGVNVLSIPAARVAIAATRSSGQPAASEGFLLTQHLPGQHPVGVVVYQAIYTSTMSDPAQRDAAFRGVAFVTLRMDDQLKALAAQIAPYLQLCIVDGIAGVSKQRLAGPPGCENHPAELQHVRALNYAGRQWELRAYARADDLAEAHSADVWMFALVGLLFTAMLGGFLLLTTGRTRRIETAVRERTAALQAEVHEREGRGGCIARERTALPQHPEQRADRRDLHRPARSPEAGQPALLRADRLQPEAELLHSRRRLHPPRRPGPRCANCWGNWCAARSRCTGATSASSPSPATTVWVQATVSLLRDAQGKPRSIVGVVEDITEHLKLEAAEHAREAAEASNRRRANSCRA
jgi:CHASE1-domain containing sensor protein